MGWNVKLFAFPDLSTRWHQSKDFLNCLIFFSCLCSWGCNVFVALSPSTLTPLFHLHHLQDSCWTSSWSASLRPWCADADRPITEWTCLPPTPWTVSPSPLATQRAPPCAAASCWSTLCWRRRWGSSSLSGCCWWGWAVCCWAATTSPTCCLASGWAISSTT